MTSEAQRRAVKKYKKNSKRITLDFAATELDMFDHIRSQPKMQTYIKGLIREDMTKGEA